MHPFSADSAPLCVNRIYLSEINLNPNASAFSFVLNQRYATSIPSLSLITSHP
ncbi:MAG: hypothetical protein QF537_20025 [SAR324 cluster bacterium]|nr:hypothetical protein [SAR324 cluster bacterium]